jgi:hypothetical protein
MLHVIQFYCYYFHTLKTLNKRPQIDVKTNFTSSFGSPPRYPPLPIPQLKTTNLTIKFHQIFDIFSEKEKQ